MVRSLRCFADRLGPLSGRSDTPSLISKTDVFYPATRDILDWRRSVLSDWLGGADRDGMPKHTEITPALQPPRPYYNINEELNAVESVAPSWTISRLMFPQCSASVFG